MRKRSHDRGRALGERERKRSGERVRKRSHDRGRALGERESDRERERKRSRERESKRESLSLFFFSNFLFFI